MEFQKPRKKKLPEKKIEENIRLFLGSKGWLTEKTHGNALQAGFPDLYCYHPEFGERWVEVKTPVGRLTHSQVAKFKKWEKFNCGVWVLICHTEYEMLFDAPNWRRFLKTADNMKFNNIESVPSEKVEEWKKFKKKLQ